LGITEIKLAVTQDGVTRYRKRGHDWPAALVDDYHLPLSPVSDICVKSAQSVDDRRARQGTLPGYGVEWVSGLGSAYTSRAGLKAWPSLRVRCSGGSPKRTSNFRLISLAS